MEPEQRPLASQDPTAQNPERWRRIRGILEQALALSADKRASFLLQACAGDESARLEVESLIRASEHTAFLDRPALLPHAPSLLPPGTRIGSYEIVRKLGQGGMGVVYLANDPRLDRQIALKVLSKADGSHQDRARFLREARAASALNHPNIVTIYEFDSDGDMDFIAMEFIAGKTLRELLDLGNLPLERGLDYACEVAGALARAHAAGIVHRDLKPQNIMVTAEGRAKILDFGLARRSAADAGGPEDSTTLTRVGSILGTPAYMSPEQVLGEPVDSRSDIFSFGIILYEIATGLQPFRAGNAQATMHHITSVDPPRIQADKSVPRQLTELIALCLKKNPAQRLQSMTEATERLAALRADAQPRRHVINSLAAAAALLLAGTLGASWYRHQTAPVSVAVQTATRSVLTCSIEAQQLRDGQPIGEPRITSTNRLFEGPWRFRLSVHPQAAGFLYLVDEGPDQKGVLQLSVLYPGEPVAAGQSFDTKWYRLEGKPGTERLWILWARDSVPAFDRNDAARVRAFLAETDAQKNSGTSVELRTTGNVAAAVFELRHQ